MSFEEYYQTVIKQANVSATRDYVKILSFAYTIEQAVQNLKSMKEQSINLNLKSNSYAYEKRISQKIGNVR